MYERTFYLLLVFFLAPAGLGKIPHNSQNIRVYYMLNHAIRSIHTIFRTDINWSGHDMRRKGGVVVMCGITFRLLVFSSSELYEMIGVTLLFSMGFRFLVCGLYHPPSHNYAGCDLMEYLVNITDSILDKHANTTIVCGGDLNVCNISAPSRSVYLA